ncbi:tRNA pseudouridine(38-40) synthase TruA [Tepidiforma bonchosmolovskayae]|uniref:tRNA pseudouridine(38-40) synthase TruA n=1 Tax=Tepidiforma bonchosmolovskayae TaxID=2601677 RepID=UPI001CE4A0C9|nr:tRNA pseudouridine(38-40) synthase TruA [Tepidiforma bonchosmolovskayae]
MPNPPKNPPKAARPPGRRRTTDPTAAKRFAATVSYDGTDFVGSQVQPNGRTVQEELERAAARLFGAPVRVELAGRTDSGVHARGQVAAFTAATRLEAAAIGRALNALLPEDVAVRAVREVPPGFDPRRWARRRRYRYTIANGEARDPLARRYAWYLEGTLDEPAMQHLAAAFAGRRNFSAFAGKLEPGRSPVRTVFESGVHRSGDELHIDIEADAFLPQMVRRIVAALVRVGRHAATEEEIVRLLEQARPGSFSYVAPARGLCLERVWYDEGYQP